MAVNSSSTAQRKKLEEKNSRAIRELMNIPANKFCFECGQRGPTYVNVTEGSFCCMHCSGLLRGLNPPQRVKSISMSTFCDDDVKKLKLLGNEENQKIWLGLSDKKINFEPRVEDEVRQHLIQKYENKRWHVSPSDLIQQKQLLEQHLHNRRDSASSHSIHSHQSNQSAPPNLHASIQAEIHADPFDLLTGDPFCAPVQTTGSLAAFHTPFGLPLNPFSHSSLPSALAFPTHLQQTFQANEKTATSSNVTLVSPSTTATTASYTPDFAAFSVNFGSLNQNTLTYSGTGSQPPINLVAEVSSAENNASSTSARPPPLPQSNPVVSRQTKDGFSRGTSTAEDKSSTSYFDKLDFDILKRTTETNRKPTTTDGKPIMSCSTLPDYSALEDFFRGSSSSTISVAPSFGQPFSTNLNSTLSSQTSSETSNQYPAFNKSSTIGNIGEFSTAFPEARRNQQPVLTTIPNLAPNPFYSMSSFTSCLPDPFATVSSTQIDTSIPVPNGINQHNSLQSAQNWNPFTG